MMNLKHLYRIGLAGILFLGIPVTASAQTVDTLTMAECFRHIPESVLPTLSENNRLDMLDFMSSNMKAEVTNRLGGKSEMTVLTDSTLTIRLSGALLVDMFLLKTEEPVEGNSEVICLVETFGSDSLSLESQMHFYTTSWKLLQQPPSLSVSNKNTLSMKKVQTILKRDNEILKKS